MKFVREKLSEIVFLGTLLGCFISVIIAYLQLFTTLNGPVHSQKEFLGGDYLVFYLAGKAYENGESPYEQVKLIEKQSETLSPLSIANPKLVFAYPPFTLLFLGPLSKLPYIESFYLWTTISIIFVFISIALLVPKNSPAHIYFLAFLISAAYYPFSNRSLAGGQFASFGILIWSLFFYFLKKEKLLLAGMALGLGAYKPPLFLLAGLIIFLKKEFRIVFGAATSLVLLVILSILILKQEFLWDYYQTIASYRVGATLSDGRSFIPLKIIGFYSQSLIIFQEKFLGLSIFLAAFVAITSFVFKELPSKIQNLNDVNFGLLIASSTLFSIQVVDYDLSLLLPVITLLSANAYNSNDSENRSQKLLIALLIFLFGIFLVNKYTNLFIYLILQLTLLLSIIYGSRRIKTPS